MNSVAQKSHDPGFPATPDSSRLSYDVSEFLPLDGRHFLPAVYRCLLKRDIDDEGRANFWALLASGRCSKAEIIWCIASSPEAANTGIAVSGLGRTAFLFRLFQLPLLGPVLRSLALLVNLPGVARQLRADSIAVENLRVEYAENIRQLRAGDVAMQQDMSNGLRKISAELDAIRGSVSELQLREAQDSKELGSIADHLGVMRASLSELYALKADRSEIPAAGGSELADKLDALSNAVQQLRFQISKKADTLLFADLSRRLDRRVIGRASEACPAPHASLKG